MRRYGVVDHQDMNHAYWYVNLFHSEGSICVKTP